MEGVDAAGPRRSHWPGARGRARAWVRRRPRGDGDTGRRRRRAGRAPSRGDCSDLDRLGFATWGSYRMKWSPAARTVTSPIETPHGWSIAYTIASAMNSGARLG